MMTDATLNEIEARAKAIVEREALFMGDLYAHREATEKLALIAALRASRERERRYETAGRMWIRALNTMRKLTVHDPMQKEVVNLMTEAEKRMRAALGEEAKS